MNSRILLTGIPGTGKTTLANYMQDNYGYTHIDLEIPWNDGSFPKNQKGFEKLINEIQEKKTVITWGFPTWLGHYIKFIEGKGFRHIWLDGDRNIAFKNFMKREANNPQKEEAYRLQVDAINRDRVVENLNPTIFNPFKKDGSFKDIKERAEEILNL